MIYLLTICVALVVLMALIVILNRRGASPPGRDDTWRDAGLPPGAG